MGAGLIGDVGISASTSSGAGGSKFGDFNVTDDSGGGMPVYVKLALILGAVVLALVAMKRFFKK